MGRDPVEYRGRGFLADAGPLEIWLWAVAEEIDRRGDVAGWLRELRDDWHLQATQGFGFGLVPDLDGWAGDEGRRVALLELFVATLAGLPRYGDEFTAAERDRIGFGGPQCYHTGGYPTAEVAEMGRQVMGLLGEPGPTTASH